jgi:hypothetical protein
MSKFYFGFAVADGMFASPEFHGGVRDKTRTHLYLTRYEWVTDEVLPLLNGMIKRKELIPCLNPSHKATIKAMRDKYDLKIEIPDTPPKVSMDLHDRMFVMSVRGLPRLTDRHEYTEEEIDKAEFVFIEWSIERKDDFGYK